MLLFAQHWPLRLSDPGVAFGNRLLDLDSRLAFMISSPYRFILGVAILLPHYRIQVLLSVTS